MLANANIRHILNQKQNGAIMLEYGFAVRVVGLDLTNEVQIESLDNELITIIPSVSDGIQSLDVVVEAPSPKAAWQAFEHYLDEHAPEISIRRVDLDLVTLAEIAERLNVSRETVRLWSKGARRENFPTSFATAGSTLLWTWADVTTWAAPDNTFVPLPTQFVERINGLLARQSLMRADGWKTEPIRSRRGVLLMPRVENRTPLARANARFSHEIIARPIHSERGSA
jgi:hypothetical protein